MQVGVLSEQRLQQFMAQFPRQAGGGARQTVDVVLQPRIDLAGHPPGIRQLLFGQQSFEMPLQQGYRQESQRPDENDKKPDGHQDQSGFQRPADNRG